MKTTTANNALERATASLQELNSQLLRGEVGEVARKSGLDRGTVDKYLKGTAPKINIATKIITAARAVIIKREQQLSVV